MIQIESRNDSTTVSQPEVFLEEFNDVAEEDVAQAALAAVDLRADLRSDADGRQFCFVDVRMDVNDGLVFAGRRIGSSFDFAERPLKEGLNIRRQLELDAQLLVGCQE